MGSDEVEMHIQLAILRDRQQELIDKIEALARPHRVRTLVEMLDNSGQSELLRRYFGDDGVTITDEDVAQLISGLAYVWDVDAGELTEAVQYVLDQHAEESRP